MKLTLAFSNGNVRFGLRLERINKKKDVRWLLTFYVKLWRLVTILTLIFNYVHTSYEVCRLVTQYRLGVQQSSDFFWDLVSIWNGAYTASGAAHQRCHEFYCGFSAVVKLKYLFDITELSRCFPTSCNRFCSKNSPAITNCEATQAKWVWFHEMFSCGGCGKNMLSVKFIKWSESKVDVIDCDIKDDDQVNF